MTAAPAEDRDRVGPYRVIKAIGAGGSARIDLARIDRAYGFQRHVVLKRPLEHLRGDAQVAASLRREARIGGQLRHPNLVAILDAGVHDGYDYLVLEYVHGAALRGVMQGDAPGQVRELPLGVSLAIISDAARGMHEAHELTDDRGSPLGLVHRDVSPGNILIGLDGTVKLADFGIAKETRVSTLSGSMHGTVTYMAPEQCQGHAFDRRADIFSLGVILYELVTGTRLFWADNDVASLHRVLSGAVPRPRSVRPQITTALEDILMTAVAHEPERRFTTALELAGAVEAYAARAGEVLGARWIARTVEAVVGPKPVPWLAQAASDPDAAAAGTAGSSTHPGPEATPPGGSLVALIAAAGADEPVEAGFGDGSAEDGGRDDASAAAAGSPTDTAPPVTTRPMTPAEIIRAEATPARQPRRGRRAVLAAIVAVAVIAAAAIAAMRIMGNPDTPPASASASAPSSAAPAAANAASANISRAAPSGAAGTSGTSAAASGSATVARGSVDIPAGSTAAPGAAPTGQSGSTHAPPGSTGERSEFADTPPGSRNASPGSPTGSTHVRSGSRGVPSDLPAAPSGSAAVAQPVHTGGEHVAPGKRRRGASKPPPEPSEPALAAGAGSAAAGSPSQTQDAGSAAQPAPPAKVEWKPTLLLPTDGSNGTPRR